MSGYVLRIPDREKKVSRAGWCDEKKDGDTLAVFPVDFMNIYRKLCKDV